VIFETTLKIIEMLDGDRDEAKAAASALIALTKHGGLKKEKKTQLTDD
jgi:hypothetical protein